MQHSQVQEKATADRLILLTKLFSFLVFKMNSHHTSKNLH